MKERFVLENNEAAPIFGAAFILDQKSGLRVQIVRFSTLKQLDAYEPSGPFMPIRNLPILLVAQPNDLTDRNCEGVMKRMVDWYYYTQLNPKQPPGDTPPVS